MALNLVVLFAVLLFVLPSPTSVNGAQKLPDSFPLCKQSDPELDKCLGNAIRKVIKILKDGVREFHLPPMDPLQVSEMSVGGDTGSVSFSEKFTNVYMHGISDAVIYNVSAIMQLPEHLEFIINGELPVCRMNSEYELSGHVLQLPIRGVGNCSFTFYHIKARLGPAGRIITKNGKQYFNVTEFKLEIYDVEDFKMQFDNLFNGDKSLGDNMNRLLNENWKLMWSDLKGIFEGAFSALYIQYSKRVFDKVPFEDVWQH